MWTNWKIVIKKICSPSISSLLFSPFTTVAMKRRAHIPTSFPPSVPYVYRILSSQKPCKLQVHIHILEKKLTSKWWKISQDPTVVTKLWPEPRPPNCTVLPLPLLALVIDNTDDKLHGILKGVSLHSLHCQCPICLFSLGQALITGTHPEFPVQGCQVQLYKLWTSQPKRVH